jgi:hypothetical protein
VSDGYDEQWRCAFGYWHVVPSLAEDCTGRTHGLGDQHPPLKAAG